MLTQHQDKPTENQNGKPDFKRSRSDNKDTRKIQDSADDQSRSSASASSSDDSDDSAPRTPKNIDVPSPQFDDKTPPAEALAKFGPLIYDGLATDTKNCLVNLLHSYDHCFSEQVHPRGADVPPMEIKLKQGVDIPKQLYSRPRHFDRSAEAEIQDAINKLIELEMAEEAQSSQFYSQVLMVRKKNLDGTMKLRFCIDYRHLNMIIDTYRWPLPLIDDLIQSLAGYKYFTTFSHCC